MQPVSMQSSNAQCAYVRIREVQRANVYYSGLLPFLCLPLSLVWYRVQHSTSQHRTAQAQHSTSTSTANNETYTLSSSSKCTVTCCISGESLHRNSMKLPDMYVGFSCDARPCSIATQQHCNIARFSDDDDVASRIASMSARQHESRHVSTSA